jgi:hypothetical protein
MHCSNPVQAANRVQRAFVLVGDFAQRIVNKALTARRRRELEPGGKLRRNLKISDSRSAMELISIHFGKRGTAVGGRKSKAPRKKSRRPAHL